jgi:hypothetical protein
MHDTSLSIGESLLRNNSPNSFPQNNTPVLQSSKQNEPEIAVLLRNTKFRIGFRLKECTLI